ncbi:hypothetical protein CsatA_004444 [Cannabis sativa]
MAVYNLSINCSPRFVHHVYVPHFTCKSNKSLSHVPMRISMSKQHHHSYFASTTADVDAHLKQSITIKPPLSVHEAMYNFIFSTPPNLAPSLCVAACELVGGHQDQAMAAASALRVIHAAIFTHDHLPLTGRPNPTSPEAATHNSYNPNIQLLLPDAIVPFGFELLANSDDLTHNKSERILRVIVEFTRTFGSRGTIDAQYHEKLASRFDVDSHEAKTVGWGHYPSLKKEGAMHACAAACGAILGEAHEEEVEKLRTFGLYVGMIQGYANRFIMSSTEEKKEADRIIEELTNLARQELKYFDGRNLEPFSTFLFRL